MLPSLRQHTRVLSQLAQLAHCQPTAAFGALSSSSSSSSGSSSVSGAASSPAWLHAAVRHRWSSANSGEAADGGGSGKGPGISGWLASKLPSFLGMDKPVEDLDLETFASSLKRARQLGSLTGFVHGTASINDSQAKGTLRLFEQVIGAMRPEEKKDLQLFDKAARQRVADEVGGTTQQVDDCIARYLWTRQLTLKVAQLKKEGKEMPQSVDAVERMLGSWREYKSEHPGAVDGTAGGTAGAMVPLDHTDKKGQRCALAGMVVGRNTKCPASKKSFKSCCGKTLKLA